MDATHKTCVDGNGDECFLYTLVVRSEKTGRGAPVCWMITNSSTHHPVETWLSWLKNDMDYTPGTIMIDNSDVEIKAIEQSYGDRCRINLCHWHILRAWRKNLIFKLAPKSNNKASSEQVREHRNMAFKLMVDIMQAPTQQGFQAALKKFNNWAYTNRNKWDADELIDYFDNHYLPKKEKWCRAWRKVCSTHDQRWDVHTYTYRM